MIISSGTKFGPYEVLSPIGAGGMGEVYKAKDTRLDRIVAIKVLPPHVVASGDLRQRFDREAKAISSLNHPHICTLYDVGHQDGIDYLVMEYIEGESLATRLEKGPLPSHEILRVAVQIADALDKAHSIGLVHRDLKPGNVMITKGGAKLLDFGLAKLTGTGGAVQGDITRTHALTGEGTIIGTLQYMAPEQIEGKEADARSDIFSFGAMLYEMSTGKRPFEGKSQASLIAAIIERDPAPISSIQPLIPPALERVVRKCMAKDADTRWQSARDLCDELRWITNAGSQAGMPAPISARRRLRFRLAWIAAIVSFLGMAGFGALYFFTPKPAPRTTRFTIEQPDGLRSINWPRISPDGSTLAFFGVDTTGTATIWIRPLNSLQSYPLSGTAGVARFFWSPDSKYLAFFDGSKLMRAPVAGGPTQMIGEVTGGYDGSWGAENVIMFDGSTQDSLRQFPAGGGIVSASTTINRERKEIYHAWPCFLSDGKRFLFLASVKDRPAGLLGENDLMLGTLGSKETKKLCDVDSRVDYDPRGYILYINDGVLLAQKFDPGKEAMQGDPFPVAEGVPWAGNTGGGFSVSHNGILVYHPSANSGPFELVWVDRTGRELEKIGEPGAFRNIALSPDESRVAYELADARNDNSDIWIYEFSRNVASRLTFAPESEDWPLWTPDGAAILYTAGGDSSLTYSRMANGVGEASILAKFGEFAGVSDVSPDGKTFVIQKIAVAGDDDLYLKKVAPESTMTPLLTSPFNEARAVFSPDGRYIAYNSNETNPSRPEVYVRELGTNGGKWQISSEGGRMPVWRPDGKELYFINPTGALFAVPVVLSPSFQIGVPVKLFDSRITSGRFGMRRYAPSRDGQRFLISRPFSTTNRTHFVVVQNWLEETQNR